jgi:hypothetical protein
MMPSDALAQFKREKKAPAVIMPHLRLSVAMMRRFRGCHRRRTEECPHSAWLSGTSRSRLVMPHCSLGRVSRHAGQQARSQDRDQR